MTVEPFAGQARWGRYANGQLFYVHEGSLYAQRFDLDTLRAGGEASQVADRIGSMGGGLTAFAFSVSEGGRIVYGNAPFLPLSQLCWIDRKGRVLKMVSADTEHLVVEHPHATRERGNSLW